MKKLWLWILTILTTFCLFACKDSDPPEIPPPPVQTYTVTITKETDGCGEVSGAGTYDEGMTVVMSATVNEGYEFLGWFENGERVTTSKNWTFVIEGDRNFVAKWGEVVDPTPPPAPVKTYTLTIVNDNESRGQVSGAGTYEEGSTVKLTATATDGYAFLGWYENGKRFSESATEEIKMSSDRIIVAKWYNPNVTGDWSGIV